jgi:paraquat-inducible protein A
MAVSGQLQVCGLWELAAVFLLSVLALPPLRLTLLALVLIGVRLAHPPRALFRCCEAIGPWAMTQVFLIEFFVAYSRLADLARIDIGPAAWSLGGLMLAAVGVDIALDSQAVLEAIAARVPSTVRRVGDEANPVGCPRCGLLCYPQRDRLRPYPRCGAAGLYTRTRVYRFVEVIGRWSMIDVFMSAP